MHYNNEKITYDETLSWYSGILKFLGLFIEFLKASHKMYNIIIMMIIGPNR